MTPLLSVDGVSGGYGPTLVVRNLSLDVSKGEIVTVLGSNGVGKSTILKLMVGLLTPSGGKIMLDGMDIAGAATESIARDGLVLVPEGRQLFLEMSVRDNLLLGAINHRRDRRGNRAQLEQVLELFPALREKLSAIAGSLSGGQQQMVAIGRGLMARPKALLLDEPSLGLAPKVLQDVLNALVRLRDLGTTILLVEQNAMASLEIADRGYVVERGSVTIEGPAAELANNPAIREAYLGIQSEL